MTFACNAEVHRLEWPGLDLIDHIFVRKVIQNDLSGCMCEILASVEVRRSFGK